MYYLIPLIICLLMALPKLDKHKNILLVFFSLFFILRFPLGRDIPNYIYYLNEHFQTITFGSGRFFLTDFLFSLNNYLTNSPVIAMLIVNTVCVGFISYSIYKYSNNYALSCFLFATTGYAQVYMNSGLRQAIGMAIFLFATYRYLLNDKYLKFAILIIISAFIHDSCLVMLLLVPLKKFMKYFSNKIVMVLTGLALFGGLFVFPLTQHYFKFIGWYYEYLSAYSISILGVGLQIVQFTLILILYALQDNKNDSDTRFLFLINCASFALYSLMIGFPLISRLCDFLQIVNFLFIPSMLARIINKKFKSLIAVLIIALNLALLFFDTRDAISALDPSANINILNYPLGCVLTYNSQLIDQLY